MAKFDLDVYPSGVDLRIHRQSKRVAHVVAVRGTIGEFSSASRLRLRRRLVRVDWGKLIAARRVVWLNLTSRKVARADEVKDWLAALRLRISRRYGDVWYFWRLEYQARGSAHLHLILVFPDAAGAGDAAQGWLVANWCEVAEDALPVAQHARVAGGIYGIASYVTDAGKVSQSTPPVGGKPGRWWGISGRNEFTRCCVRPFVRIDGRDPFFSCRRLIAGLRRGRVFSMKQRRRKFVVKDAVEFLEVADVDQAFRLFV